ncbi:MAG: HAMP domain-containing histidine kinase [Parvibaculum sp.]|nr:HAMP domain-containing histidine kinase [Parvibaculum sp.]
MSKSTHSTITRLAIILALAMLAVVLVDAACASLQALAQHRLIAEGTLVLAVASAFTLGIAIGRRKPDAAVVPLVSASALASDEPVTASGRVETMTLAETEFLANMSHELHTPLNAVIGFSELILSEIHGPLENRRYSDYVGHIRNGGEQLLTIVNAILDMSRLAAGQFDLQLRRVEPHAIVDECARSVAEQAAAAEVSLVVQPSNAPSVMADPARLAQALINLLSNAIKFTAPGGLVTIGVTCHGDAVAFEVADTGIGMTRGQVDIALQPFRMIESCMTRRQSGIGLGLPLAEHLVRLHGGELRIESGPGYGTAVTAILPASASHLADEQ